MNGITGETIVNAASAIGAGIAVCSGIGPGGTCNNRCVCHCAVLCQSLHDICYGRCLLTDCNVNTVYALPLLIDDRIDRDCCLTGLSVADDQLTLSSSDRNHGVNRLDTRLKRCVNRLTGDNARCDSLDLS